MDFTQFEQDEFIRENILHPVTGKPTDGFITVFSTDSKRYRRIAGDIAEKKAKFSEDDAGEFMLASLTDSWENIQLDGEDLEFSVENAMQLYSRVPFIYKQLEKVIFDSVKFMKATPEDLLNMLKTNSGSQDSTKGKK